MPCAVGEADIGCLEAVLELAMAAVQQRTRHVVIPVVLHVRVRMWVRAPARLCVRARLCVCVRACVHVCTHVCMHACILAHVCMAA